MKDTILRLSWIPAGVIVERQSPISFWVQQNMGVFMKEITAAFLATVFVLYSLVALLSVELNQDSTSSPLVSDQGRISEVGLRVAFQR